MTWPTTLVVKTMLLWLTIVLPFAAQAHGSEFAGFVTKIESATTFDIGLLNVLLNEQTSCETRTFSPLKLTFNRWTDTPSYPSIFSMPITELKSVSMQCDALNLAIGTGVRVKGALDSHGDHFLATHATSYVEMLNSDKEGGSLIEEHIESSAPTGRTALWIDGYPINITHQTKIVMAPPTTRFHYRRHLDGTIWIQIDLPPRRPTLAFLPGMIRDNTWVLYHASRTADGRLVATELDVWPNHIDKSEDHFTERLASTLHQPNYSEHTPGSIRFEHGGVIGILPNQSVQAWISRVGIELVPPYQKDLLPSSKAKIRFMFYVIKSSSLTKGSLAQIKRSLPNIDGNTLNSTNTMRTTSDIISLPNGLILIPDTMLTRLHNTSQLAALLSFSITSVLQKQAFLAWPISTSPGTRRVNFLNSLNGITSFIPTFGFWLDEQVLRVGTRSMLSAGYDIREAPFAWAVAQGKPENNPVIDSNEPDKEIPWYAAYAFNYISQYYSDVDYSKLKKGEAEYAEFLTELRKADPEAFEKKCETRREAKQPRAAAVRTATMGLACFSAAGCPMSRF